ncbi:tail fiber protein [Escherichia coli]|uniref:tail fiber protein n=1 Tax=Escherichia coli TaxID=562 RepID=UPI000FAFA198|nr:tail fiber protein [Escherichia coli]EEW1809499.1 tail fiber protein [Escherichia coli]EFL9435292.1 tail fiber protein [Escherichia coli]EHK0701813.1 tail fiber protein [Escherichia coli]EHK7463492.1 tail fiber protein [Escherichia coli]MDF7608804.1 phage tail protein [Escherichia coli]
MAINNFKPFALDPNANVTSQADWEALPALLSGFTAGKASSAQVNKAIRQASFIAAALAQYTANKSGLDVLDDGDLNGFISKMRTAFGKDFQALDATLSALAGLATGANKLPYFTGNDTAAQTNLTSVGRDIIGKNTIADILTYLGLGLGSALPVGVPVPWPLTTPPTGWMKCNGSRFSLTGYPALAAVFPSGVLPDLRGEFIRGWDDGRGVDAGRAIMTTQEDAIQNITGEVGFIQYFGETHHSGALFPGGAQNITNVVPGGDTRAQSVFFDASRSVRTASENRPRNIAFNYIVRAA